MHPHHTGEGKFIHKQRGHRETDHSSFWKGKRKAFSIANVITVVTLQVMFLANLANLFGSTYHHASRVHNLKILLVNYDGGVVGQALSAAYQRLKGDSFPTLQIGSASDFPDVQSLSEHVCKERHIWAAIYTHNGASTRLAEALEGGEAAATYNASDAITYIWNGVRYTTYASADVSANIEKLISLAGSAYFALNSTYVQTNLNTSSTEAVAAAALPFRASNINLMPTVQTSRTFLATTCVTFTMITQFFYVLALNGIAGGFGMLSTLTVWVNMRIRWVSSIVYSCAMGAVLTGVVWAFRESWPVTASQGFETWLTFSWVAHIHFLVFDTATGFIPVAYMAYFAMTWMFLNITSSGVPIELAPGFYHWQYALPSYQLYQVLVTILSHGCVNQNFRALPILFVWWVAGLIGSWLSMINKCNAATQLEEEEDHFETMIEQDVKAEEQAENDLEKAQTRKDDYGVGVTSATGDTTVAADEAELQERRTALNRDIRKGAPVPDVLYYSTKTPFQNTLALAPAQTVSAQSSRARPRLLGRGTSTATAGSSNPQRG